MSESSSEPSPSAVASPGSPEEPTPPITLGIDFGGTSVKIGVVRGAEVVEDRLAIHVRANADAFGMPSVGGTIVGRDGFDELTDDETTIARGCPAHVRSWSRRRSARPGSGST